MVKIEVLSTLNAEDHAALARLLGDAVERGASVGYLLPFAKKEIEAYWQDVAIDVAKGNCKLLVARRVQEIIGTVQLALASKPNGRHRAEVQKLLVHSNAQRLGIGLQLMRAVEALAIAAKRTLLVLDTETDSGGCQLYKSIGYQVAGEIPCYAIGTSGGWTPSTFMYKLLGNT
ncbi:MAG: GNAT family N-acetyltransferase [Pseudomonadota bacterium]